MKNFNFKTGTHKQILYDYLLLGKSITTKEAMIDLGIGDLQGVIRNLKKEGVAIETKDKLYLIGMCIQALLGLLRNKLNGIIGLMKFLMMLLMIWKKGTLNSIVVIVLP